MNNDKQIVTDAEIEAAFKNTDFGVSDHRRLLECSVLKKLVGYHCGHTITTIMIGLGLIGKAGVTKKGKQFAADAFNELMMKHGG
jgi:hypothetical protein